MWHASGWTATPPTWEEAFRPDLPRFRVTPIFSACTKYYTLLEKTSSNARHLSVFLSRNRRAGGANVTERGLAEPLAVVGGQARDPEGGDMFGRPIPRVSVPLI